MKKVFFAIAAAVVMSLIVAPSLYLAAIPLDDVYRPQGLPTGTRGQEGTETSDAYSYKGIQLIIADVISIILLLAGGLAVFEIINNSWAMISAFGSGEKIDAHKKGLFWAIAGLIFVLLSYIIFQFLIEFVIGVSEESVQKGAMLMRIFG